MTLTSLKPLFLQTLRTPGDAAVAVMAMGLPVQALWMTLTLVSILSSLSMSALFQVAPMPEGEMGALVQGSPANEAPLVFAIMQWARVVLSVFVIYWVGRALGGRGTLGDVLAVLTWLQVVTFVLLAGVFILGFALPLLSSLAMMAMFVWWLWAVVSFIDVAHGFGNPFKAAAVLVISVLGTLIGLGFVFGVIASVVMGVS